MRLNLNDSLDHPRALLPSAEAAHRASGGHRAFGGSRPFVVLLLVTLCWGGCTDSPLERRIEEEEPVVFDNKLQVSGKFCTSDPSDLVFPLKVLFIIDTSQSMNVNDPVSTTEPDPLRQTGRCNAITEVIEQFIDINMPVDQIPTYCNTGVEGCEKGSTQCAACGAPDTAMCIGPDCCKYWNCPPGSTLTACCRGVPPCPDPVSATTNGTCTALCDTSKPGCGPGETSCEDCPPGDQCKNGVCATHLDPGVEFAIMRFGSAKQVLTHNRDGVEGFTNDVRELVTALPQVNNGGSVTDYEGALAMAFQLLSRDMLQMQKQNTAAVSRSKYVVVFLSDGQPDPKINNGGDWETIPDDLVSDLLGETGDPSAITQYNVDTRILRRVKEILGLRTIYNVGEIRLHTAYLAGINPTWLQDLAVNLLKQMAQVGQGTFRNFQNGEEINFLHVDFSSLRRVFRLKNFLITNVNARPAGTGLLVDSDGDGLDDGQEDAAGTDRAFLDTDQDGFSDTVEYFFRSSGWDALDPVDADCSLEANDADGDGFADDLDGDGLLDCEERFLGTSRSLYDTDADGIPDGVEVRFGTNPVAVDVEDDLDFDGMPNGEEIRLHTDPRADDAAHRSRASYRYDVNQVGTGIETVGLRCNADADCPSQADCRERFCRCINNDGCSTLAQCQEDLDCTRQGETCQDGLCVSGWTCQGAFDDLKDSSDLCAAEKHVTCYEFETENIALVTPTGNPNPQSDGWNQINLVFGEVPFDNPMDYGNFRTACVMAYYNDQNGSKLPATGKITVPEIAWNEPEAFTESYSATLPDDAGGLRIPCGTKDAGPVFCNTGDRCLNSGANRCAVANCLCPDGAMGSCIPTAP